MNSLSNSRRLRDKIRLMRGEMDAVAETLWTHPRLREIYPEFLFRNHSVIRSSVPLMKAAAEECEKLLGRDPLAEGHARLFPAPHTRGDRATTSGCSTTWNCSASRARTC